MQFFKVLFIACLGLMISLGASARPSSASIHITSIALRPEMPGDLSLWPGIPGSLALSARTAESSEGLPSWLRVRILGSDGRLCAGKSSKGIRVAPFVSRDFTATELLAPLSDCERLSPGSYQICFQFFNAADEALSPEQCQPFTVASPGSEPDYAPPVNKAPADNQLFVAEEAKRPIRFEWTPVAPQPDGPVTYLLRIWPMKEGQSREQAIEGNKPLLSKDVTNATMLTLTNELPFPCEPPYTCSYAWTVQALDGEGNPIGRNKGTSQPSAFTIADYIIRIKGIQVNCTPTPGLYTFSYIIENLNPGTAKLSTFVVTSSTPAGAAISSFTPPLNTNIASGGSLLITGTIVGSSTLSFICIGAEITDVSNSFWKASRDTCIPVGPCKCDACSPEKVRIIINPTSNLVINANNTLTMTQPITVATTPLKLVNSIKAELQYFEFLPDVEACLPCNPDPKTYGNMEAGTLAGEWAAGSGTHALHWTYAPAKNFSSAQNAVMTFTLPPSASCCVTIRWCIRYVIRFSDCTVCTKVVCYEKKKPGCTNGGPNPNNN